MLLGCDAVAFWCAVRALAGLETWEMASAFWWGINFGFFGCRGPGGLEKIVSQVLSEPSALAELLTVLLPRGCAEHPEAVQTLPSMDTG